jgi:hypothetical protein
MTQGEQFITIDDSFHIGSFAAEDHSLVHECALATAPIILLQSRHGCLVSVLLLYSLLLG